MATISYKCDTCKRETELIENKSGFTVVGKCNITEGCLGHLYKTARNPNNVRESSPSFVEGLSNYIPRRALFEYRQTLPKSSWEVTHDMGVLPATFVYLNQPDGTLKSLDVENYTVTPNGKNKVTLTFDTKVTGIVQCVARSTVPMVPSTLPPPDSIFQVSTNGFLTLAVPKFITYTSGPNIGSSYNVCTPSNAIKIDIEISKPNEDAFVCSETIPNVLDNKSPWNAWNDILIAKRRNYCVRTVEILKMKVFGTANLKASDIPNGTRIRFLSIDYGDGVVHPINSRSVMALLSKKPYQYADKITDRLVDIGEMKGSTPDYFVYIDGEVSIDNALVEKTYPDICQALAVTRATPSPSSSARVTPTPSVTPSITVSLTPEVTPSPTPSVTPTTTVSLTPDVTPTPTLTSSTTPSPTTTPTITPTITPTTSQNAVSLDFDYAVVRFDWDQPNGTDLDIRVEISNPPRNVIVGADREDQDGNYLIWGGDNQTEYGQESVLIGFNELVQDYGTTLRAAARAGISNFIVQLRAFWYGVKRDGNIRIDYISYKGGTMQKTADHDFINIGGTVVDSKSVWVNTQEQGGLELDGENVAYIDFDIPSNRGELIVVNQAVTPTPTPSVTPSNSPTPTVTPTSSVTPTISVTPSITPSITADVSPTVTPTSSVTPTVTRSVTPTISVTPSITADVSPTVTPTNSATPSVTRSVTPTISLTPSVSSTPEVTKSATPTITPTITASNTVTPTQTPIVSPTRSPTPTVTPTSSVTPTQTRTMTPTPSATMTVTPTPSPSMANIGIVSAGADTSSLCANTVPLNGSITGGSGGPYVILWEQLSGPSVEINNPSALSTFFTYTTSADRVFRLWVNKNQPNQGFADVTVFGTPSDRADVELMPFSSGGGLGSDIFLVQPQFVDVQVIDE